MEKDSTPRIEMQKKLGVHSEYLTPEEIKKRYPYLETKGIKSGSFNKLDGVADPSALLLAYEKGAKKSGITFATETNIKRIVKENNKVTGIETEKGILNYDVVILAAGLGSKELGKTIGIDIPFLHKRKYVLSISGFDFDFPVTMEIPTGWYIKKEGTDALTGMSGKDEKVDYELKEESEEEIIMASIKRFPKTENASVKKVLSTMSDEVLDKHAIIDSHIPGLIIATAFSGHGFMHSPATGKIITSLVKEETPIIDISELKLNRKHIKEPIAI